MGQRPRHSNGDGKKHKPLNYWANDPRWSGITHLLPDVVRSARLIRSSTRSRVLARSASGTLMTPTLMFRARRHHRNQAIEMVQAG